MCNVSGFSAVCELGLVQVKLSCNWILTENKKFWIRLNGAPTKNSPLQTLKYKISIMDAYRIRQQWGIFLLLCCWWSLWSNWVCMSLWTPCSLFILDTWFLNDHRCWVVFLLNKTWVFLDFLYSLFCFWYTQWTCDVSVMY